MRFRNLSISKSRKLKGILCLIRWLGHFSEICAAVPFRNGLVTLHRAQLRSWNVNKEWSTRGVLALSKQNKMWRNRVFTWTHRSFLASGRCCQGKYSLLKCFIICLISPNFFPADWLASISNERNNATIVDCTTNYSSTMWPWGSSHGRRNSAIKWLLSSKMSQVQS